jgi:hypothetical protein
VPRGLVQLGRTWTTNLGTRDVPLYQAKSMQLALATAGCQSRASIFAAFPSPCIFSATFQAVAVNPSLPATCRPFTIALRWFSEFFGISTVFRQNRNYVPTGTFNRNTCTYNVPPGPLGRESYRMVSSISEIQLGRFSTSRGLGPSAAPTIPSCSIRSMRCAARP